MKKTFLSIALIIILILSFCACGKSDSAKDTTSEQKETPASDTPSAIDSALIGNWQESIFDSGFIFNADGTGTDTFWDLTFTYSCDNGEILIVYDTDLYGASKYNYAVTGDSLSMTRIDEEEASSFTYIRSTAPQTEAATSAEDEVSSEAEEAPDA